MKRALFVPFGVLFALVPARAQAQPSPDDVKRADALFQAAKEAMDRADYAHACAGFSESQRLDPGAGTLLNLGECESHTGKLVDAVAHFEKARAMLPPSDYRAPFTERRIREVRARTPRLTLRLASTESVKDVQVVCDGTVVARESMNTAAPIDPGLHVCLVRVPGRDEQRVELTLAEGESRVMDLVLAGPTRAEAAPAREAAPATNDGGKDEAAGRTQRTWGIVVGALGAATLATGAVFGLLAKSTYDDATTYCGADGCTADGLSRNDRAHSQAAIATGGFIAGGALLVTGAVIYLTAPHSRSAVSLSPQAGAGTMGWQLRGSF